MKSRTNNQKFYSSHLLALTAIGGYALATPAAHAALYATPIDNASFENPVLDATGPGSFTSDTPGWANPGNAFTQNLVAPAAPQGSNWGGFTFTTTTFGVLYQQIGTFSQNMDLSVTFIAGDRSNKALSPLNVEIWAGGLSAEGEDAFTKYGSTTLASNGGFLIPGQSKAMPTAWNTNEAANTVSPLLKLDFNTGLASANYSEGDALWLRFVVDSSATGGSQVFIDDIKVVPEPSAFALLACAGLGLIVRRRR